MKKPAKKIERKTSVDAKKTKAKKIAKKDLKDIKGGGAGGASYFFPKLK